MKISCLVLQAKKVKKYKSRHPKTSSLLVIVLSCPQIDSLSSSTANQREAQNNYRALGCHDLYYLNFVASNILELPVTNKEIS